MRHLWAWWSLEDRDPESGLNHLDHAAACLAMLIETRRRYTGKDDRRPVRDGERYPDSNLFISKHKTPPTTEGTEDDGMQHDD